jgi:hypothetical protein
MGRIQHFHTADGIEYYFERRRYGTGAGQKFFTWLNYRVAPTADWKTFGDPWPKVQLSKDELAAALNQIRAEREDKMDSAKKVTPDFEVNNEGSIYLLRPLTEAASGWIGEHIPADAQVFGEAVVVEHRYIGDIVKGIQGDGLKVVII